MYCNEVWSDNGEIRMVRTKQPLSSAKTVMTDEEYLVEMFELYGDDDLALSELDAMPIR